MKFQLTFKTPDILDEISFDPKGMSVEEREDALNSRFKCEKTAKKYVEYGEYITIEFDTSDNSARAIPLYPSKET